MNGENPKHQEIRQPNQWANKMSRHFSTDKVQMSINMKKVQSH